MDESINPVSGSGDGVLLLTDGRLLVALDDFINPKTGRKIFGCAHFFDHAAKANQSKYPWA